MQAPGQTPPIAPTRGTPSRIHGAGPTCAGDRDSRVSRAEGIASKESLGRQPGARPPFAFCLKKQSAPRWLPRAGSGPAGSLEAPPRSFRPCRVGSTRARDLAHGGGEAAEPPIQEDGDGARVGVEKILEPQAPGE